MPGTRWIAVVALLGGDDVKQVGSWPLIAMILPALAIHAAGPLPAAGPVAITEIHYNPPRAQGQVLEFIELRNTSGGALDLEGWRIQGGVRYEFPRGPALSPGAYALVCRDADAFRESYGAAETRVIGTFEGALGNGGDDVELLDASGAIVDWVHYDDRFPWPVEPDGHGASLQRLCETAPGRDPLNWTGALPPTPAAGLPEPSCPPPGHEPSPVVISEIHYHPIDRREDHPATDDGEYEEFIEIINAGQSAVDIGGWRLQEAVAFTFPAGYRLEPQGRAVVGRDAGWLRSKLGVTNVAGSYEGKLSNAGGRVILVDARGLSVDAVRYRDGGDWPYGADGFGHSLERIAASSPGWDPANWQLSQPGEVAFQRRAQEGSVGQGLVKTIILSFNGAGDVIVDNVVLEDVADPGVNIIENGDFEGGMSGWSAKGLASGSLVVPEGGIAGSHGLRLVSTGECPGGECGQANGVSQDVTSKVSAAKRYRVTVDYRWVRGAGPFRAGFFNGAEVIVKDYATPGRPGSSVADAAPPFISRVNRHPIQPTSGDSTWITAHVRSAAAPTVLLTYDAGGDSSGEIAMLDDGRHRDVGAGDGVFGAEIPAFPHNTQVRFRIRATAGGASRLWPSPRFPLAPFPEEAGGYYVNDRQVASPFPTYTLLIPGADPSQPTSVNAILDCSRTVRASFAHRGDLYPDVQMRFRGNTACYVKKRNFKIIFNRSAPFEGLRKVNLNSNWTDKAMVREHLAWEFMKEIGAPHSETAFVRVHLNGEYHGLFLYLEHPDGEFLERNNLSPGNIYKARQPILVGGGDIPIGVARWPDVDTYRLNWERETNEQGDFSDIVEFVDSMHADGLGPRGPTAAFWGNRTFEETIIRYQIGQVVLNNIDSFAKNHFLYHDLEADRWGFITWDMDLTFGKFFMREAVGPGRQVGTLNDYMLSDPDVQGDLNPWFGATVLDNPRLNWLIDFLFRAGGDHYQRAYLVRLWNVLEEKYRNEVYDPRLDALAEILSTEFEEGLGSEYEQDFARWDRYPSNVPDYPQDMLSNIRIVKDQIRLHRDFLRGYIEWWHPGISDHPRVKIVEIMYLPEGGDDRLEFLELFNAGDEPVDLSGWIIDGISYRFPPGSVVPARALLVVARSPEAFRSRYPTRSVPHLFGPYEGRLADDGEELRVLDPTGGKYPATVDLVRYGAKDPWPLPRPGRSLELTAVHPDRDNDDPESWVVSASAGGSPGSASMGFIRGDFDSSDRVDMTDAIAILMHLFQGGAEPRCEDAGDANDDGSLNVTDSIYLLSHLFVGGAEPPPPYPRLGADPTPDTLRCDG